jgi:uncharacterized alkaline shock family protein YloU
MTEGQASISTEILARYAADAASEVEGVRSLVGRRGVKVTEADGLVRVELHLAVDWGASIPTVGCTAQARVREYLGRMADLEPEVVDVTIDEVGSPNMTRIP